MNEDDQRCFRDSFASPRDLKQQLIDISSLIQSKPKRPTPRFLAVTRQQHPQTPVHPDELRHFEDQDATDPSLILTLVQGELFDFRGDSDRIGCLPVSYTWQQTSDSNFAPVLIRDVDGTVRPSRAPSKILRRAVHHAATYTYLHLLWIDQECINQYDDVEKELAVQNMNSIYKMGRALFLVDLDIEDRFARCIEPHIESADFDDWSLDEVAQLAIQLSDFLDILSSNAFFQRAWITQERLCSPWGYDDEELWIMRTPWTDENPYREIPIFPSRIQTFKRRLCERLQSNRPEDILNRLQTSHNVFEVSCEIPSEAVVVRTRSFYTKSLYNCGQAMRILRGQKCTFVADKVALVTNCCSGSLTINTREIERLGLSYSACIWALAISTGEATFFCQDPECHNPEKAKRMMWAPSGATVLSDIRCTGCIKETRMEITEAGLSTTGWLFRIDRFLELAELQAKYAVDADDTCNADDTSSVDEDRVSTSESVFFEHLLTTLVSKGELALGELVWKAAKRRNRGGFYGRSVFSMPDIPLTQIIDSKTAKWIADYSTFGFKDKDAWEKDSCIDEIHYGSDPTSPELWPYILGNTEQLSGLLWIQEAVLKDGGLSVVRYESPTGERGNDEDNIAISPRAADIRSHIFAQHRNVRICRDGQLHEKLMFNPHPFDVWLRERDTHLDAPFCWAAQEQQPCVPAEANKGAVVEALEMSHVLFHIDKIKEERYVLAWPSEYSRNIWA
ncbi:hypothetical protein B0I35DRAFT_440777 [Stachybotrys elegans]|uniref:Heterokaryon incompatibility domain-containing protein n=1 Tax=Stachybotrys elegans TaxID=80388 RepID=A0A8K0SHH2_9HYPO|nr:hypothetical protein B0I35DRAFT_440777 [Stachybotrys elegans]